MIGTDQNFYGRAIYGGVNGYGTIFSVTEAGALTTLHNFDNTDGANPFGRPNPRKQREPLRVNGFRR